MGQPPERAHEAATGIDPAELGGWMERYGPGLYRWERYFDALDAGFDEPKGADGTVDGPYFRLSVGFGC